MPYTHDHPDLLLLQAAWLAGHAFNPREPEGVGIEYDELPTVELDSLRGKALMRSWQGADANLDTLVQLQHGRAAIVDGDVGPATRSLAKLERCGLPDHPPPAGMNLDAYGPAPAGDGSECSLRGAVESYREYKLAGPERATRGDYSSERATGTFPGNGAWLNCDPERDDVYSTRVSLDTSQASAYQKSILEQVLKLVRDCEATIGQAVRWILNGDPREAEHDVRYEYIAGDVIGFAYFPIPNSCNQVVKCRLDNSWNPQNHKMHAVLHTHEYKGHSDGLEHTRGGVLNPSILLIDPLTWKGDPHERTKKRFYGGEPIEPTDPVDPPPTPTNLLMLGTLTAKLNGVELDEFVVVPRKFITG